MVLARCEHCRFSFEAPEPPAPVACQQCGRPASRLRDPNSVRSDGQQGKTTKLRIIEPRPIPTATSIADEAPAPAPDDDASDDDKTDA